MCSVRKKETVVKGRHIQTEIDVMPQLTDLLRFLPLSPVTTQFNEHYCDENTTHDAQCTTHDAAN